MDQIITDFKILRQISKETTWKEVKRFHLKDRLEEAMKKTWCPGIGLAAIQIGAPLRYAWYKFSIRGKVTEGELLNPKILTQEKTFVNRGEGCLSIPNYRGDTLRFLNITMENDGKIFAVEQLEAVLIQHEVDHMNGILVSDIQLNKYAKLGRNDLCGCGSGKKYKKCCLR